MKLIKRLFCLHPRWEEGRLVNWMTGAHEYTCLKYGKTIQRANTPVDYIGP